MGRRVDGVLPSITREMYGAAYGSVEMVYKVFHGIARERGRDRAIHRGDQGDMVVNAVWVNWIEMKGLLLKDTAEGDLFKTSDVSDGLAGFYSERTETSRP